MFTKVVRWEGEMFTKWRREVEGNIQTSELQLR